MIYLELSKSVDNVPNKRLIYKLQTYGIKRNVLLWIESFLAGRRQRVPIHLRELLKDSILGLIRFILFINDLKNIQ